MTTPVVIGNATLYCGDSREILPTLPSCSACITDPPYGVTSLDWDKRVDGWHDDVRRVTNVLWCFGSLAFFLEHDFGEWIYSQEIVWEKHNGSIFHADRFRRVHELAVMFYTGIWRDVYKRVQTTPDATKRTVRRKQRPTHSGDIERSAYASSDGGPRMMRSVIRVPSCHGFAEHPTQKPVEIIQPLIEYSCPPTHGSVLDPFMGSGSTGVACMNLGRKFIGIEIERKYFDIACERIDQAQRQGRMFA